MDPWAIGIKIFKEIGHNQKSYVNLNDNELVFYW